MLNIDMLCHCPNLPSMVICEQVPAPTQNKEAV